MADTSIKTKFLAGWLDSRSMRENPQWLQSWIESAERAEQQDYEFVVFRIPRRSKTGSGIAAVEQLLQDMFPDWEERLKKLTELPTTP